jgi:hypothetical protein
MDPFITANKLESQEFKNFREFIAETLMEIDNVFDATGYRKNVEYPYLNNNSKLPVNISYLGGGVQGTAFKITANDVDIVVKVVNCDDEDKLEDFDNEVMYTTLGTQLSRQGIPNLPYNYGSLKMGNKCFLFLRKANGDISELFNHVDCETMISVLKQMVISIYLVHTKMGVFHCDSKLDNHFYFFIDEDKPKCWTYNLPFGKYYVQNKGITTALYDFGLATKDDPKGLGCNYFMDYSTTISSIKFYDNLQTCIDYDKLDESITNLYFNKEKSSAAYCKAILDFLPNKKVDSCAIKYKIF